MRCARKNRLSFPAGNAHRHWHLGLGLLFLSATGVTPANPAAAQATGGSGAAAPAGGGLEIPAGAAPSTLPPAPGGGFGFANPFASPDAVNTAIPAQAAPGASIALQPAQASVTTLQQYDPNAPAVLIQPLLSVGERLTDNVNFVHAPRRAAAGTTLTGGLSISADTPRLQGVASGSVSGSIYTPTSNLDQIFGNLYANGFGTILPDALFVDAQSAITQSSPLAGLGFTNLSQLPSTQQTQVFAASISPYFRKSFDGVADTELRYRFGSTNFSGNTRVATTPVLGSTGNLSSSILNEGTFIAASGRDYGRTLTRLTIDYSDFSGASTSSNTSFSAYDDLEFRITPEVAALARAGYQNLQYPRAPAATFAGATWLAGGRVGFGPDAYATLEYGRQQGVYGFSGAARYNITPTLVFTATLQQGISSPTQQLGSDLAASTLDPYGAIVNQYSGLPTAFYSPGLGLTNNVYRQHLFNAGLADTIGPNRYSLYGFYTNQQSLTTLRSLPTKTLGLNLTWGRDIRPDLNSNASIGYSNSANVMTLTAGPTIPSTSSYTAYFTLNYLIGFNLTGSVQYSLSYQTNGIGVVGGRNNDIVVNQVQFLLSKTF
jgi:hypothetical protein